jgi:hypothetical protein
MVTIDWISGYLPVFFGLCAFSMFVIGMGVLLRRKWAQREFEALRKKFRETEVTDPEYNAVRALYISAAIDHERMSGADGLSSSGDAAADSGGGGGGD